MTSPTAHKAELAHIPNKLNRSINCYESEIQDIFRMVLMANQPMGRGNLGAIVQRQFFQDPLLKTIRYLENIDYKEQTQKVQFLQGLEKVLDKFERKFLIDKVMPLLMASLQKDTALSIHVLPIVITQLKSQNPMTPTQFRDKIWPAIINLCA